MAHNSFGQLFRITTWGESHGKALGVVIDGCPSGLFIDETLINAELFKRQGGKTTYTTPRKEPDLAKIYSGVFEGKTTGAPISIIIENQSFDSSKYEPIKDLYKPGHANYTYLNKYGIFDYRGGGRASARETVCRVAAGAIAKQLLKHFDIELCAYLSQVGKITIPLNSNLELSELRAQKEKSLIFCPDQESSKTMEDLIKETLKNKDSIGGVVSLKTSPLPIGLGEPTYYKLEAALASAMMSIPASKGFEIGSGFLAATLNGSLHNDTLDLDEDQNPYFKTNFSGGILGGISSGTPLETRVAFKPTSSIGLTQKTINRNLRQKEFKLPKGSKHDPCVAIRAVPVVEAMAAITLADFLLCNRCSKLDVNALEVFPKPSLKQTNKISSQPASYQ